MIIEYETDIRRVIKWLHNEAVYLPTYIENKAQWYDKNDEKFWGDWLKNVFDIRTANAFGLAVWCFILGVPTSLFDVKPQGRPFAFGQNRQNFIAPAAVSTGWFGPWSGPWISQNVAPVDPSDGGNFVGSNDNIKDADEIRKTLRLRYAAMISNGNIQFINKMFNFIFNDGKPWNVGNLEYMYLADSTTVGFEKTRKFYRDDWRGRTEVPIGIVSHNYFPRNDIFVHPSGSGTLSALANSDVPDKTSGVAGKRLTITSTLSRALSYSGDSRALPPTSERTMVYGACIRNPTVSNPKYRYVRVDVHESSAPFGVNNPFSPTKGRISSDVIDTRPIPDAAPNRDGLMVKVLDDTSTPYIWVEVAARFTSAGRAGCLVVTPCDVNGADLPNVTGAVLDLWFPICRKPSELDAYWRGAPGKQYPADCGQWTIENEALNHRSADTGQPDVFDTSNNVFRVIGVEGHSRTVALGDELVPVGAGPTSGSFTIQAMSVPGSAPSAKTIDYRIGANTEISSRLLAILRERKNDIMFQHSGIPYTVTRES